MNTKRILISVLTGMILTASVALAAHGNDQPRSKARVKAAKATATTNVRANRSMTTQRFATGGNVRANRAVTTQRFVTGGNPREVRGTTGAPVQTRTRVVTRSFSYPYGYSYGYPYYGYGYGYGPSVSFGFGYPSYGYYPYAYDYGYYPYNYSYGYNYYNRPAYGTYANGSIVIQVQSRLARAGYYHGPIDGVMGPRTRYAISAYERTHGLPVDGTISGPLLRNMGLRY